MADTARYYRISPKFWSDPIVLAWNDDTRLLALYLLTCPHRTTEGIFRLPTLYAQADLGWTEERFAEPFAQLLADGFIEYDHNAHVVLITSALKWQTPDNPNQVKAAVKQLLELPPTPLAGRFRELAEAHSERLAEALPEGFGEPLGEGLGESLAQAQAPAQAPSPALSPPQAPAPTDPDEPEPEGDEEQQIDHTLELIRASVPRELEWRNGRGPRALIRHLITEGGWRPTEIADEVSEGSFDQARDPGDVIVGALNKLPKHRRPPDVADHPDYQQRHGLDDEETDR